VKTPTQAIVLTAGLGTRLQPLTSVRAKPAVPVAREPLVRRIIRWLVAQGVTDLVLNLHHLPYTVARVVGDGGDLSARVRYSWEQPIVLGSAGGPRVAQSLLEHGAYFLINGDTMTDLSLEDIWSAHKMSQALVTLAVVNNTAPDRYSGLLLNADGAVVGVAPKGAATGSYHFIGVQVVEPEAFAMVSPGSAANSIGGVFNQLLVSRPGSVRGFVCSAQFWDIGTVQDYWRTSWEWSGGRDFWPWDPHSNIHQGADVHRSILWDDVEVQARARLDECIVTDGVSVAAGSSYRRSILIRNTDGRTVDVPFDPDERQKQDPIGEQTRGGTIR
jgi:NDP-sugar pyrophosphorylase family protein